MSMDAIVDRLVDTCESNWVEKQALGPMGSKVMASTLLALAGGAAGAGAGFMFDRGRIDPDESPSARVRKMKQRMLRGAGIGAAVGGAAGLMAAPGPRPLEPHERAEAIKSQLGPKFNGGLSQEAAVRSLSGQPVNKGVMRQLGRTLWDSRPELLGGTPVNNAAELAGTALGPALYMQGMGGIDGVMRRTGAANVWDGLGGAKLNPMTPGRTVMRALHLPVSQDYQQVLADQGMTPAMARMGRKAILRELLRQRNMPSAASKSLALPGTRIPITRGLSLAQRFRLTTGLLGKSEADVISRMTNGSRLNAPDMHAMQGLGINTKTLGTAPAPLVLTKRLLPRAIISYYLARVVSNEIMDGRMRMAAGDAANRLVAR